MKLERLFHVLVVIGGASAAACETDEDPARRRGGEPDAAADAAAPGVDAAADQPCFCDQQVCCDRTSEPAHVVAGFTCCWSTTCP